MFAVNLVREYNICRVISKLNFASCFFALVQLLIQATRAQTKTS